MDKTSRSFEMIASQRPNPQFRALILALLKGVWANDDVAEKIRDMYVQKIFIYRLQMICRFSIDLNLDHNPQLKLLKSTLISSVSHQCDFLFEIRNLDHNDIKFQWRLLRGLKQLDVYSKLHLKLE